MSFDIPIQIEPDIRREPASDDEVALMDEVVKTAMDARGERWERLLRA
jgi:hypothetical protein